MAAKNADIIARIESDIKEQLSHSAPSVPLALYEMGMAEFDAMMLTGLNQAKTDNSRNASDVFSEIRREMRTQWQAP